MLWALGCHESMKHGKKTAEGARERLGVICKVHSDGKEMYKSALSRCLRKHVARDGILDALVAAVTARYGWREFSTLGHGQEDEIGLPMEMLFWSS